jgi:hypothetical protein
MDGWKVAFLVGLMLVFGCMGEEAPENAGAEEESGNSAPALNETLEQLPDDISDAVEELPGMGEDEEEAEPEVDYTECVDTDGGDDKWVFGQIKLLTYYTDGSVEEEIIAEDKCVGTNIVQEYLCREGGSSNYRKMEWTCLNCEGGACTE